MKTRKQPDNQELEKRRKIKEAQRRDDWRRADRLVTFYD
jgi:hypothetical protein